MRSDVGRLGQNANSELEVLFKAEDDRLQTALNHLQEAAHTDGRSGAKTLKLLQIAKAELVVVQTYDICVNEGEAYSNRLRLESKKGIASE